MPPFELAPLAFVTGILLLIAFRKINSHLSFSRLRYAIMLWVLVYFLYSFFVLGVDAWFCGTIAQGNFCGFEMALLWILFFPLLVLFLICLRYRDHLIKTKIFILFLLWVFVIVFWWNGITNYGMKYFNNIYFSVQSSAIMKNENYCDTFQVRKTHLQQYCYKEMWKTTKKVKYCELLTKHDSRQSCFSSVLQNNNSWSCGDSEECKSIAFWNKKGQTENDIWNYCTWLKNIQFAKSCFWNWIRKLDSGLISERLIRMNKIFFCFHENGEKTKWCLKASSIEYNMKDETYNIYPDNSTWISEIILNSDQQVSYVYN